MHGLNLYPVDKYWMQLYWFIPWRELFTLWTTAATNTRDLKYGLNKFAQAPDWQRHNSVLHDCEFFFSFAFKGKSEAIPKPTEPATEKPHDDGTIPSNEDDERYKHVVFRLGKIFIHQRKPLVKSNSFKIVFDGYVRNLPECPGSES